MALRSYLPADHPDKVKEIGSEATPADFIDRLLDVVESCDRVLAPHGTVCFELGDTYAGSGGAGGDYNAGGLREGQTAFDGTAARARTTGDKPRPERERWNGARAGWPLAKSLCGIPTLFAWSLAYGRNLLRPERTTEPWRIRNLVAWCRPNPPPGALGDKWRPATSYVMVATKSGKRWFDLDAVRGPYSENTNARVARGVEQVERSGKSADRDGNWSSLPECNNDGSGAPPLDFLVLPTEPYKGAHYATFPRRLVEPFVKSMCPERVCTTCGKPSERITERSPDYAAARDAIGDFNQRPRESGSVSGSRSVLSAAAGRDVTCAENITVGWSDCGHNTWRPGVTLDPFAGSGTTLEVATGNGREAIGIDLDERNAELARERCGMFLTVEGER